MHKRRFSVVTIIIVTYTIFCESVSIGPSCTVVISDALVAITLVTYRSFVKSNSHGCIERVMGKKDRG